MGDPPGFLLEGDSVQDVDGAAFRLPQAQVARPDICFLEWRFDRFKATQA